MTRVIMLVGATDGPTRTHIDGLARRLRERGDEVLVVSDDRPTDSGAPRWPSLERGAMQAGRELLLLRRWARHADVVHAHGTTGGLLGAVATTLHDRPRLIVSQHRPIVDSGWRGLRGHLVQWVTSRRADLVTGASSDLVASAAAHGARRSWAADVPSPQVPSLLSEQLDDAARDALRRELLGPLGADPSRPLVVTICALDPQHRIPDLLDAADEVETPVTWVVVGDGEPEIREHLTDETAARGLPLHRVDPGSPADTARWLQAADLFVLPSSWEARPMAVQDAMAAGVPVVATDVGGLRDLVDGVGLLVPVGDPAALGGAVDAVLGDQGWRAEMVAAGRRRAATWQDDDETAQRWHQWYVGPYPS